MMVKVLKFVAILATVFAALLCVGSFLVPSEEGPTAPVTTPPRTPTTRPTSPAPEPEPTTVEPILERRYSNCSELREDHPRGVQRGNSGYRTSLDRDRDGWACEQ